MFWFVDVQIHLNPGGTLNCRNPTERLTVTKSHKLLINKLLCVSFATTNTGDD